MLTALEKGQNEFMDAVRPPLLMAFLEEHKLIKTYPDTGKIGLNYFVVSTCKITESCYNYLFISFFYFVLGKANFLKHLSFEAREALEDLVLIERNKTVEKRILPPHYYSQQVFKSLYNIIM